MGQPGAGWIAEGPEGRPMETAQRDGEGSLLLFRGRVPPAWVQRWVGSRGERRALGRRARARVTAQPGESGTALFCWKF